MGMKSLLPAPSTTGERLFILTEMAMFLRRQSHFPIRTRKYNTRCVSTSVSAPAYQAILDVILACPLLSRLPAQVILAFYNVSMACLLRTNFYTYHSLSWMVTGLPIAVPLRKASAATSTTYSTLTRLKTALLLPTFLNSLVLRSCRE